ncbi:MAG: PIG-L family deacetylase [Anaerolineales bacterium]|nr:PIG-L family deacetylase [Anaerolineales bacterium]
MRLQQEQEKQLSQQTMNAQSQDYWPTRQQILVILAHPDDPEFFCGATLARWARAGHQIRYYLLTCGDKGANDATAKGVVPADLCALRYKEQRAAAEIIGVKEFFLSDNPDGYLVPDLDLRREVVRAVRRFKPDILVTCDPTNMYPSNSYGLNHPDHRAAGQVVLDAVFPAAGNRLFFPELLVQGFEPHTPREIWISLTNQPNVTLDVTKTWPIKIKAILQHASQIPDRQKFLERWNNRHTEDSTIEAPRFEEYFRRLTFG